MKVCACQRVSGDSHTWSCINWAILSQINSMSTHMSLLVSIMDTHRGSILRSPQCSRTLVQRFTLQRPIHRFRHLCFAHILGDRVLRRISQGLLLLLGQHLRDVQHASLHTPTSSDVPASTPTVMSDFSSFSSLFGTWCQRGRKLEGSTDFRRHVFSAAAPYV